MIGARATVNMSTEKNPKPDVWERLKFLVTRLPRIISILRELYVILFEGREGDLDLYLTDLHDTVKRRRQAQTLKEKQDASQSFANLISRL